MKKIKDLHKYIIGFILGIIVIGSVSVYAVGAVINSKEVSYNNETSHGSYKDVQNSIDELYKRSGVMKTEWKDPILHGADPVFDDTEELIPVTIDDNGTVKYANLYTKWYEYETKRWANAVILTDIGIGKNYKTGDTIIEDDIESYFVWIPRYKYKIWNLGEYDKAYNFSDIKDTADEVNTNIDLIARRITGNEKLIDIVFGNTTEITKMDDKQVGLNEYYTHPAFTLGEKELNGIWVGKFETGGTESNIVVKPNVVSWRNATVGTFWNKLYNYKRGLDSHMMKNTEWGAVAYLLHSVYGIGNEININNNLEYKTGYSAAANTDQSSFPGEGGTTEEKDKTQPWNTSTGYLASTTGNITGVYDMSGGASEYMASYADNFNSSANKSGLTTEDLATNSQYFDKYSNDTAGTSYNRRILGDATAELGPFYKYYDKSGAQRYHNSWYGNLSNFINSSYPWFNRGGARTDGGNAGELNFDIFNGGIGSYLGSRLVLAIK